MELILIRHGKAEERSDQQDDSLRKLTQAGKKHLQLTLPSLGLFIKNLDKVQIWTSPLVRAVQTADLVARQFGIQEIQQHDFIADGDLPALTAALAGLRQSATVIIVGHEPTLGDWARNLCGAALTFKKGAAACIRLDTPDMGGGELLWFFQPLPLSRLGEKLFRNSFHRS